MALHTEPGFGVLRVTDNGPGVDAALAQQLQQRWAQGDQGQRLGQGAGLGLAIVARYVQLMEGRLELAAARHQPPRVWPRPGGQRLAAAGHRGACPVQCIETGQPMTDTPLVARTPSCTQSAAPNP